MTYMTDFQNVWLQTTHMTKMVKHFLTPKYNNETLEITIYINK